MKFYIYTLGCKVNQYESEAISEKFIEENWCLSENASDADLIIINSCSVTAESDRKARQALRRFRKNAPNTVIVLCGCFPEGHPLEVKKLKEADIIFGNGGKNKVYEKVCEYLKSKKRVDSFSPLGNEAEFESMTVTASGVKLRAVVKIEDGTRGTTIGVNGNLPSADKFKDLPFLACENLTIFCENSTKPNGWENYWNNINFTETVPVIWGT